MGSSVARAFQTACAQASQGLQGISVLEIQLSEVQAELAEKSIGVAWLSDSSIKRQGREKLVAVGGGLWDVPVEVVAYRARGGLRRNKSDVWERIRSSAETV